MADARKSGPQVAAYRQGELAGGDQQTSKERGGGVGIFTYEIFFSL